MAMSNSSHKMLFWILAMLGALGTIHGSVSAWPAANVGLTRFEAVPLDNAVRLEWDTETELETAGFRLKRGQNQDYDYLMEAGTNSPLFLSSQGGPATGASYAFTDESAVNGESYVYQLVEVEVDGRETIQAESEVRVGLVPTDTPIVLTFGGGGGGEEISVTATATVTPTLGATTTAVPTAPAASTVQVAAASTTPGLLASPTPPDGNQIAEPTAVVAMADALQPESATPVPVRETNAESGTGPAVALAQEDPEGYPVEEPTPTVPPDVENQQGVDVPPETVATVQPGDSPLNPAVIGATAYPINPVAPTIGSSIQNTDSTSSSSILAGRVYLWVGFTAALVIFAATVLGAILLYTRRRSKE